MYLYLIICLLSAVQWRAGEWQDALDLPTHGQAEEDDEVDKEDGPEDGDVGGTGQRTCQSNSSGLGSRVPELELWQAADKRAELFVSSVLEPVQKTLEAT